MTLGVWGGNGSFTEEAAFIYAKQKGYDHFLIRHFKSIEMQIDALHAKELDLLCFPIKNSIGGIVREAETARKTHPFVNYDLFDMEIHQNLLVYPGTKSEQIKKIISHYQPLKQTANYIAKYFPQVTIDQCDEMSVVARDIALSVSSSRAVIASKRTAEIYGLEVLRENIEDVSPNITTFLIVAG